MCVYTSRNLHLHNCTFLTNILSAVRTLCTRYSGHDATREFEDVGHSGDARKYLDKLVIGSVRPATDEELRIARVPGKTPAKKKRDAITYVNEVSAWIAAHSKLIKHASASSAVALVAIFLARRYVIPYLPGSRR